jgi:hypothetical protein
MLEISRRFSQKCNKRWLIAQLVLQRAIAVVADWPASHMIVKGSNGLHHRNEE